MQEKRGKCVLDIVFLPPTTSNFLIFSFFAPLLSLFTGFGFGFFFFCSTFCHFLPFAFIRFLHSLFFFFFSFCFCFFFSSVLDPLACGHFFKNKK